jgi:hypothetical protein
MTTHIMVLPIIVFGSYLCTFGLVIALSLEWAAALCVLPSPGHIWTPKKWAAREKKEVGSSLGAVIDTLYLLQDQNVHNRTLKVYNGQHQNMFGHHLEKKNGSGQWVEKEKNLKASQWSLRIQNIDWYIIHQVSWVLSFTSPITESLELNNMGSNQNPKNKIKK